MIHIFCKQSDMRVERERERERERINYGRTDGDPQFLFDIYLDIVERKPLMISREGTRR